MRALKITKQITNKQSEAIDKYLMEISKIPLVSSKEEAELAQRIKQGDSVATERLVQANLRFVISVAKQYQHHGLPLEDLINEGNLGLIKATQKFDHSKGFKFISYAVWWIRQSIMQAITEKSRTIRLSQSQLNTINKINKTSLSFEQKYEREPSLEELAELLDLSSGEISQSLKFRNKQTSLDTPFGSDSENNLLDLLEDTSSFLPDALLNKDSIAEDIRRAVSKLPNQMAIIITLHYGLNGIEAMPLENIGKEMNLTRERVRQIKQLALKKLLYSPFKETFKSHL